MLFYDNFRVSLVHFVGERLTDKITFVMVHYIEKLATLSL